MRFATIIYAFCSIAVGQEITPAYLSLHVTPSMLSGTRPWPSVGFGALRLLGDTVNWNDVNPSPNVFDFTKLDRFWLPQKRTA